MTKTYEHLERVIVLATKEEYKEAARTLPKDRTPAEKALVSSAYANNMVDIKNLDYAAKQEQKYGR